MNKKNLDFLIKCFVIMLCVIPFFSFYFINSHANKIGMTFPIFLTENIRTNVHFLSTLCLPLIAFSINDSKTRMNFDKSISSYLFESFLAVLSLIFVGFTSFAFLYAVLSFLSIKNIKEVKSFSIKKINFAQHQKMFLLLVICSFISFLYFKLKI